MRKATGEYNVGLLGGQDPELFERIRELELASDTIGLATELSVICVLCHLRRGIPFSGKEITLCTGVESATYGTIKRLGAASMIAEHHRENVGGKSGAATVFYESADSELTELADSSNEPDRCGEMGRINEHLLAETTEKVGLYFA